MLIVPPAVGAVLAGWSWRHALLLVAWLVGYLAFHAAGLWLRSGRRPRYRRPVAVYGGVALVLLTALLASAPGLLRWSPVFAVLLTVSLVASIRRADRSWWNDAVTVGAACLLTPVAAGVGAQTAPAGPLWTATGVLAAYFMGTVPYVKSMIRDRDDPRVLLASVVYHAVVAAVLAVVDPVLGVVGLLLAARAAVVPWRWPRARPGVLGIGEVVATVVVTAALLVTV